MPNEDIQKKYRTAEVMIVITFIINMLYLPLSAVSIVLTLTNLFPQILLVPVYALLITLPLSVLVINLRSRKTASDPAAVTLKGSGSISTLCMINIVISVIFAIVMMAIVGLLALLYYIGSHY